jgi:O-antigen biosynthesis protein
MPPSRGIVVLGMHRNGTSVLTRGLQSLGVYLGDDFLETRPDNPTGYWENRRIVEINERVLAALGLDWESIRPIEEDQWTEPALRPLAIAAADYLESYFLGHPLWGFKDPRTIRLLSFWRPVFRSLGITDDYVVVVRNPLSVVSSLRQRQGMEARTSHLLWLLYMLPNLGRIADRSFVVVDYDLMMTDPRGQLERIARRLDMELDEAKRAEIAKFADDFVDPSLRHNMFGPADFDTVPHVSPLSRQAYVWLHQLASDRMTTDDPRFWPGWQRIVNTAEPLLAAEANTRNPAV